LLDFISRVGVRVEYKRRSTIFSQGDPAESVFYILKGKIKITVVSEHGKEAIVALLDGGSFFGEGCLAGQPRRVASASAASDCVLLSIGKQAILHLIQQQPGFSELFVSYLLARNIRYEEDLIDHLFNSSEKRLARTLLLLSNFGREGKPEKIVPKISQEDLAQMVGTTRARVSHFMNKFRNLGFIDYHRNLEVRSSLLNVILHD
jgi:CRP-like cAMP-binding protein